MKNEKMENGNEKTIVLITEFKKKIVQNNFFKKKN